MRADPPIGPVPRRIVIWLSTHKRDHVLARWADHVACSDYGHERMRADLGRLVATRLELAPAMMAASVRLVIVADPGLDLGLAADVVAANVPDLRIRITRLKPGDPEDSRSEWAALSNNQRVLLANVVAGHLTVLYGWVHWFADGQTGDMLSATYMDDMKYLREVGLIEYGLTMSPRATALGALTCVLHGNANTEKREG